MDAALATPGPAALPLPDAFGTADRRRLGAPAVRAFARIADLWGLTERERLRVLGQPGRSTYYAWLDRAAAGGTVAPPLDVLLRISGVLGVHKALAILFDAPADRLDWLRRPHAAPVFGGVQPLAHVTEGTPDGILRVRRFLDAARGGLFMPPDAADAGAAPYEDDDLVLL